MRKSKFYLCVYLLANFISKYELFAQATNKIDTVGNVGIGTTSPAIKLDIVSAANPSTVENILSLTGGGTGLFGPAILFKPYYGGSYPSWNLGREYISYGGSGFDANYHLMLNSNTDQTTLSDRLTILGISGNIGIGTTSPGYKLDVQGVINTGTVTYGGDLRLEGIAGYSYPWNIKMNSTGLCFLSDNAIGQVSFLDNGKVGIGTSSPSEKLSVNGNISAKKLIVTQSGWSDYVFAKNYKLRSLTSLETFIAKHKHLPEVPSTRDVEEYGISVGDNQALLLKKIEELTLYVIRQQKEIEMIKGKIKKK